MTAWGIPLITCVAIAATHNFGSAASRSSGGWCWIKFRHDNSSSDDGTPASYFVMELMAGKIWEFAVCVLALGVCVAIKYLVWKRSKRIKESVGRRFDMTSVHGHMGACGHLSTCGHVGACGYLSTCGYM